MEVFMSDYELWRIRRAVEGRPVRAGLGTIILGILTFAGAGWLLEKILNIIDI
jgi:hypothetical protein